MRSISLPLGDDSGAIQRALWLGTNAEYGAALDNYLRAFDAASGKELWKGRLPAGGQATPMTYVWKGRQYVVIAAGGHAKSGTKRGDEVVAFALPR